MLGHTYAYIILSVYTGNIFYNCLLSLMNCQAHLKRVLIVAWYWDITTHNLHTLDFVQLDTTFLHGLFLKEHDPYFIYLHGYDSNHNWLWGSYMYSLQIVEFQIWKPVYSHIKCILTPGRRSEYFRSWVSNTKNLSL